MCFCDCCAYCVYLILFFTPTPFLSCKTSVVLSLTHLFFKNNPVIVQFPLLSCCVKLCNLWSHNLVTWSVVVLPWNCEKYDPGGVLFRSSRKMLSSSAFMENWPTLTWWHRRLKLLLPWQLVNSHGPPVLQNDLPSCFSLFLLYFAGWQWSYRLMQIP